GLLGGLGIDDATELHALPTRVVGLMDVLLLVGNDADGEAADARVSAEDRLAVRRLVFVELRAVDDARDDLLGVVLARRVAIEDAVDLFGGIRRSLGLAAVER